MNTRYQLPGTLLKALHVLIRLTNTMDVIQTNTMDAINISFLQVEKLGLKKLNQFAIVHS